MKEKEHEEEVTDIIEKYHIDKGTEAIIKKRKRGRTNHAQQKLPSSLSYQDKCFSVVAIYFLYCGSYPPFKMFRSDPRMQKIHSVAREN